MTLSPSVITEIKAKLNEAKSQVAAYEAVLRANAIDTNGSFSTRNTPSNGLSFTASVLRFISESPEGLSRGELVRKMQEAQVPIGGKTRVDVRVSTELYRLKAKGKLKQVKEKYRLP